MQFIEINPGLSVAIDHIEAIERVNDLTCKVYLHFNTYDSMFPYSTLLGMIEIDRLPIVNETERKLDAVLNQHQHFAG